MKSLQKKFQKSLLTMFLAATAFAGADWMGSDCEYPQSSSYPAPTWDQGFGYQDGCCGGWLDGWFLNVDALYWKVTERGIPLGTLTEDVFFPGGESKNSKIENLNFQWDPGVRVTLGNHLPCDSWSVRAIWTHYSSTAKKHVEVPFGSDFVFTPALGSPLVGIIGAAPGSVVASAAKWKMHVDTVDLDLVRDFCVSNCFKFSPFVGLRGMWLHQNYRTFNTVFPVTPSAAAVLDAVIPGASAALAGSVYFTENRFKTDFAGAGIRGGFDSEWKVGCGWSLYGCLSGSLLYGHCHSHGREFDLFSSPALTNSIFVRQRDHYWETRATTDAALGIRWNTCLCDCYNVTLQLGWEQHILFDQNQFEEFADFGGLSLGGHRNPQRDTANLTMQGVTFSAGIDF